MTKKKFNLIAFIIGSVFLMALIYLFAGIASDRKNGSDRADDIFQTLLENTVNSVTVYGEPDSYSFKESFIKSAGNFKNYKNLTLFINGEKVYSYPPQNKANSVSNADSRRYKQDIVSGNGKFITIQADIYTVRPGSIYLHSRIAFIIIFIGTVASILILFLVKAGETDEEDEEIVITSSFNELKEENSLDEDAVSDNSSYEVKNNNDFSISFEDETPEPENPKEEVQNTVPEPSQETVIENSHNDTVAEETVSLMAAAPEAPAEPENSLPYLPESQLNAALEEELVLAASSEQDFSVFVIKVENIPNEDDSGNALSLCIKETASSNGTVFQFENDSYVLLLKNTSLDESLTVSETLYEKLNALLKTQNLTVPVTIGISARTGRLISAERLFTEAFEARKHADNESPVIAFRVNPEKYRDFILNN